MTELGTGDQGQPTSRVSGIFGVRGFAGRPVQGSPKEEGKALRRRVPRGTHAELSFDIGRPDAVSAVEESNLGRIPELTPIRVGRMAATPSPSCAVRPASWRTTSRAPP